MRINFKRVWSGVATIAVASSTLLAFGTGTAHAAGNLAGPARVKAGGGATDLFAGTGATSFQLKLPTGAACDGDSANDGYRWTTYMVPGSVDPSTLTFDPAGPTPAAFSGPNFRVPLYDTGFSPIVSQQTANASPAPGPGPIINIPNSNYEVFTPGDITPGVYNIGVACLNATSTMEDFWNVQKTFVADPAGGSAQVSWTFGFVAAAPTLNTVTGGDAQLTANFNPATPPSDPPTTSYTATATPTGGGPAITATGAGTANEPPASQLSLVILGLTNGVEYSVVVHATNFHGDSAASNAILGTPADAPLPAVTNLTATPGAPGSGTVDLDWDAPSGDVPTGYQVDVVPAGGTVVVSGTSAQVTGLAPGSYTFTVTPLHPAPLVGQPASAGPVSVASATTLIQDVTVTRPTGALVLTQICGKNGPIPADITGTPGFPSGSLPAIGAAGPGTAPTTGASPGGPADPEFDEYPYPENADGTPNPTYPTHCGINLGNAKLIKSGPGRGQFFAASGVLNQVTVVDTRDTDTGWGITGTMSTFVKTGDTTKTFSGSQLGWTPAMTDDSDPFADSLGINYDQVVVAGPIVLPNSLNSAGLATAKTLGSAGGSAGTSPNLTGGLGVAELDARLKLLIPITEVSGVYTGTLTVTVA